MLSMDSKIENMNEGLREMEDRMKKSNLQLSGVPEEDNGEIGDEEIFGDKMTRNFSGLLREINPQIQKVQRSLKGINKMKFNRNILQLNYKSEKNKK